MRPSWLVGTQEVGANLCAFSLIIGTDRFLETRETFAIGYNRFGGKNNGQEYQENNSSQLPIL